MINQKAAADLEPSEAVQVTETLNTVVWHVEMLETHIVTQVLKHLPQ